MLGTYEIELHDIVAEIVAKRPDVIFNIGAAEGYYAVGLAQSLPLTQLFTWEISENGRALSRTLAKYNEVQPTRL
jgi:predicted O-methyltransferase YrrM